MTDSETRLSHEEPNDAARSTAAASPSPAARSGSELLTTDVQFLPGVGPERAELLQKLGLHKAADVLFYFPRDWEYAAPVRTLDELEEGVPASVRGVIDEVDFATLQSGKTQLGVLIREKQGYLRAMWYNQTYLRE